MLKLLAKNSAYIEIKGTDDPYAFYLLICVYLLANLSSSMSNCRLLDHVKNHRTATKIQYSIEENLIPISKNEEVLNCLDELFESCEKIRNKEKKMKFDKVLKLFKEPPMIKAAIIWIKRIIRNYCHNRPEYKSVSNNMKSAEKDIYWIGYCQLFADALQCSIKHLNKEGSIEKYEPKDGERFLYPLVVYAAKGEALKLFLDKEIVKNHCKLENCIIANYVDAETAPLFADKSIYKIKLLKTLDEEKKKGREECEKLIESKKIEQIQILTDILKEIEGVNGPESVINLANVKESDNIYDRLIATIDNIKLHP